VHRPKFYLYSSSLGLGTAVVDVHVDGDMDVWCVKRGQLINNSEGARMHAPGSAASCKTAQPKVGIEL